jgi:transposase-like protein
MSGHGEKLSHKQERAIAALLVASSVTAAAQQIGVNENTLLRWLKDAAFQSAYREARRAVVQQAITQVQRATGEAVETLRRVMQDAEAPASARVSAAKAILETAIKAIELEDLEQRIVALEMQQGITR